MPRKQDLKAIVMSNINVLAGDKKWGRVSSFAKEVGINTKHARDILEKGIMPKIDTLQKIASAYDINIDALLQSNNSKIKADQDLVEIIVLQKKCRELAKKNPLFKRNHAEGLKLHLDFNKKGLEHQATGIIDALWAISQKIYGKKKSKKTK
jgi:transcriptional regulator with XRE-family HTH domain